MVFNRLRLGAALAFLYPATASALCPTEVVSGALSARFDASALDEVAGAAVSYFPSELAIPETPYTLMQCSYGFDDTVITPRGGAVQITLANLTLRLEPGGILVDAVVDVKGAATLDAVVCAAPDALCDASVDARGVRFRARIEPSVAACELDLALSSIVVTVDPARTSVELANCGLYDNAWSLVYGWIDDLILGYAEQSVEAAIAESLPPLLEELLTSVLADGIELAGMRFSAAPESVVVTADSILLTGAAGAEPLAIHPCIGATPSLPLPVGPEAHAPQSGMLSLAASRPYVQRIMQAAWLAGWLCFDTRDAELDLSAFAEPLLGETSVHSLLRARAIPSVRFSTGGAELQAVPVEAQLFVQPAGGPESTFTLRGDVGLDFGIEINRELGAVVLVPAGLGAGDLLLTTAAGPLQFSAARLSAFIERLVLPAFEQSLGTLPVAPTLFVAAPMAISVDSVRTEPAQITAVLELHTIDASDTRPPETNLAAPPPEPSGTRLELSLDSTDDSTPRQLLRHRLRVDGVSESAPRYGEKLQVEGLDGGWHSIALAAVDLQGNVDPTPLVFEVLVDSTPPVIEITSSPSGLLEDATCSIAYRAADDMAALSPLTIGYEVGLISREDLPDAPLAAGQLVGGEPLLLSGMPEGALVRVTISATDAAGNRAEDSVAFAVDRHPTLDCAAGVPGAAVPCLALLLLLRRARRF